MSLFKDRLEIGIQEAELETQKALIQFPPFLRWLLIFCVIATIPAYYIAKSISKNIWLSRYNQNVITAKPSFVSPVAPKISPVSVTTIGAGTYAAIVEVSNQNLDLSAGQIPYLFTFYNSQKQQVYSYTGNLFLLPNQTKYVSVPTFKINDSITYANFTLPDKISWQKKLTIPSVSLITSAPNYFQQNSPQAFVVQGDFVNQSPYALKQVHLTFVLFDTNGKIVGVSQRDEFTVAPFERRTYKQLWPQVFAANLSTVKVTADTNTLDPNNLVAPVIQANPASNLNRPQNQNPF